MDRSSDLDLDNQSDIKMKRSESDGDLARTSVSSASSYVLVATPREALDATETVFCQVCLDHASAHDAFVLTRCGHGFCCACITQYVTVQINDGRVDPVCFSENRTDGGEAHVCGQAIADEDVQSLVSAATWEKVERFRLFQSNPNARVCPQCDHVQVFERGHKKLQCVCATCATTFCFVHNDAHLGQKCAKYVKAMAAAESHAQAVIRNTTKPCPGCRNPIEKNGGCNHMTCSRCQTEFCWVCGVMVPRSEPHWDIGGCPRMPLLSVDGLEVEANQWHNTTATQRVRYVVLFILRLPIYVVACVLALVLWVKQPFASNFDRFARTGTAWCILAIDWVVGTIKEVMSILTIACIYSVGCTLCVAVSPFFGWKQFWIELKASTVGVHEWARGLVIDPVQKTCFCCHADIVKTDGCPHAHCPEYFCGSPMCWLCDCVLPHDIHDQETHFKWWSVFGCRGSDMITAERNQQKTLAKSAAEATAVVFALLPALVMVVVMWPWPSFRSHFQRHPDDAANWCLRKIVMVPVAAVGSVVLMVVRVVYLLSCVPGYGFLVVIEAVEPYFP